LIATASPVPRSKALPRISATARRAGILVSAARLAGLFAYKMANTLDSMSGTARRVSHFGWAAARFDDLLSLVPARLSGVLLALAAVFAEPIPAGPSARCCATPASTVRERRLAGGGNGRRARPRPGGPRQYAEGRVEDPWVGNGTPPRLQLRSRARCGCTRWRVWSAAVCCSGSGWPHTQGLPGKVRRSRRCEQSVEIQMRFEVIGELIECRFDEPVVIEITARGAETREKRAGRNAGKQTMQVAAATRPSALTAPSGRSARRSIGFRSPGPV